MVQQDTETLRRKLTAKRISDFECRSGKAQDFLWCDDVPGLAVRTTKDSPRKCYIVQAKVFRKTMRLTIGDIKVWSVDAAQQEARRLKRLIDEGHDPRIVKTDAEAQATAKKAAAQAAKQIDVAKQLRETVTARQAWDAYVKDRTAATKNGKLVWGTRHKAHHNYFVQEGGVKRKRGRRAGESAKTRPGILVPLLQKRLVDLDSPNIAAWVKKTPSVPQHSRRKRSALCVRS